MNIMKTLRNIKKRIREMLYYSYIPGSDFAPAVIAVCNSFSPHCGLADRLRHALSLYLICKDFNKEFKISYVVPFDLEKALVPASFDWSINKANMTRSPIYCKYIPIESVYKSQGLDEDEEAEQQKNQIVRLTSRPQHQYHIHGNMHYGKERWKEAFDTLFAPSDALAAKLETLHLPDKYEAVTLRFQQLLGDFFEPGYKTLSSEERTDLIQKCISKLDELYKKQYFSTSRILITSDSSEFIRQAQRLPYAVTIPGPRTHIGYDPAPASDTFINSFVDLFALKRACRITLLKTGDMYASGFPEFASIIGEIPFRIISF